MIKLLQQSTFRRYAAIVLSPFFCCFRCATVPLTGVINYVFCIYFLVTTSPLNIKPSRCFAYGLYASACQISPLYDTALEEIGPRQNKQTLKYLVDINLIHWIFVLRGSVRLCWSEVSRRGFINVGSSSFCCYVSVTIVFVIDSDISISRLTLVFGVVKW